MSFGASTRPPRMPRPPEPKLSNKQPFRPEQTPKRSPPRSSYECCELCPPKPETAAPWQMPVSFGSYSFEKYSRVETPIEPSPVEIRVQVTLTIEVGP